MMRDTSLPPKGDSVKWKDPPFCFHESKKYFNNEDLILVVLRQGEDQSRTQKILTQNSAHADGPQKNSYHRGQIQKQQQQQTHMHTHTDGGRSGVGDVAQ